MKKLGLLLSLSLLASTPAWAIKKCPPGSPDPCNPLGPPVLYSAAMTTCDDDANPETDPVPCVCASWSYVEGAARYSFEVTTGFDTDETCGADTYVDDDFGVPQPAEPSLCDHDGDGGAVTPDVPCVTFCLPVSAVTTTLCLNLGTDETVCDPQLDPGDVLVPNDSLCVKVKAMNPPKKGPRSISQSTVFSNIICPDEATICE